METAKRILDLNEGLMREIEDINNLNKGRLVVAIQWNVNPPYLCFSKGTLYFMDIGGRIPGR